MNINDTILLERMPEYKGDFQDIKELYPQMLALCREQNGIGLACNQVNIPLRMFVIIDPYTQQTFCLVNPNLMNHIGSQTMLEGCLSFPEQQFEVERSTSLTAAYVNENGEAQIINFEGILARCFMHELDHLNGITFKHRAGVDKHPNLSYR